MSLSWCCAVLFVSLRSFVLGTTNGLDVENPVCILGAGYSGLGTARYLKEYKVPFKVFEATRHVGGTWWFDPHVGTDEDGLPLFTSMYKNLRTNSPRQTMEYALFPFPEGTPSFPSSTCVHRYLKTFSKKFGIDENIQFRSLVTLVKWAGHHWNVTYRRTDTRNCVVDTEACSYLIVASGHHHAPNMPSFVGLNYFKGNVIHSHDYRDPESYRSRRVLIVGAGPSGLDLATHLSNVTSKLIHSHHLAYNQPYFGPTYVKKPDIKMFTDDGVVFNDDTFEKIDDVIFCTGYVFEYKFLDKSCGIIASSKFLMPLYQHMVNIIHPSMLFIGVSKKVITRVFDSQAQYAAALIAGKFKLPSQTEMLKTWLKHVYSLQQQNMTLADINVIGSEINNYLANLTLEAGVNPIPPVLTELMDFKNRYKDLLNYRDYDYRFLDDHHYERWYNRREKMPCPMKDIEDQDDHL